MDPEQKRMNANNNPPATGRVTGSDAVRATRSTTNRKDATLVPVSATPSISLAEAEAKPPSRAGKEPASEHLVLDGSRTIIIEHCKQCNSFKTRATQVKNGLEKSVVGVNVVVNPEKPRKGCFEIREEGGEVFVSLLDMKRPFTPMKELDMEKVISDILEKIKAKGVDSDSIERKEKKMENTLPDWPTRLSLRAGLNIRKVEKGKEFERSAAIPEWVSKTLMKNNISECLKELPDEPSIEDLEDVSVEKFSKEWRKKLGLPPAEKSNKEIALQRKVFSMPPADNKEM